MKEYPIELIGKGLESRPKEERIALARKGGQSKSLRKSEGQKTRRIKEHIRRGNFKDIDSKWLLDRLENRDAMAIDLLVEFDRIKLAHKAMTFEESIQYVRAYLLLFKCIHGNKLHVDTEKKVSVIMNIDSSYNYPILTPNTTNEEL